MVSAGLVGGTLGSGIESCVADVLRMRAPKSSFTLFSPDTHQSKTLPRIIIEDSHLPLFHCLKILGVYLDTSLSFKKHSVYVE